MRGLDDAPMAEEQQPHQARLFSRIVWIQIVGFTLFNLLQGFFGHDYLRRAVVIGCIDAVCLVLLALNRAGRTTISVILNICFLVAFTTSLASRSGGISAPGNG